MFIGRQPRQRQLTPRPLLLGHVRLECAFDAVEPDDVAIAHTRERSAVQAFGADVDRRRYAARRTRHATVGHQCDPMAALLQHRQRRRQRVQFRHAIGARSLEAHHHDHIAIELAGGEGRRNGSLIVEYLRRGLDHAMRVGDR